MKYVRTPTGIYEFPKGFTTFVWNNKTLLENEEHIVWTGGEVIAQADTIKELCDEFVVKWDDKMFPYSTARQYERFSGYGDLKRAIRIEKENGLLLNKDYTIKGVIWTDKGLIYVAKMNDKGELELL